MSDSIRQLDDLVKQNHCLNDMIVERNQLITDLADALEQASILHLVSGSLPERFSNKVRDLVQRAREVARA